MKPRSFLVLTISLFLLAAAMCFYVWQLRKHANAYENVPAGQEAAIPPENGTAKQVTLWLAFDDPGVLRPEKASLLLPMDPQAKAGEILRAVIRMYDGKKSSHSLPMGAEVRNVYFMDGDLAVVDLSLEVVKGQTSGIFAEELTIASLVQTLSTNFPNVSRVKFLVNGSEAETLAGHADLSIPVDVAQTAQLAKELAEK